MPEQTRDTANTDGRSKTYWTPARVLHKAYLDWMKESRDGDPHDSEVRHIGEFADKRLQEAGHRGVSMNENDRLRELAKVALDVATSSNDCSSGFLDNEEVEALRELATMLGVDPMKVTPDDFKPTYCPGHEWSEWKPQWTVGGAGGGRWRRCRRCDKTHVEGEPTPEAARSEVSDG